jgi:hypothetical protein
MNQGPRRYCLMKKTEGQKSCDTVPLTLKALFDFYHIYNHIHLIFICYYLVPSGNSGTYAQTSQNIDCALGPLCYIRACSI